LSVWLLLGATAAFGGCAERPDGLENAEPLDFEIVLTGSAGVYGDDGPVFPDQPGVWVIEHDSEFARYCAAPGASVIRDSALASKVGDPPRIPDGLSALLVAPGVTFHPKGFEVTGVYDEAGQWTVTVAHYADPINVGDFPASSVSPAWVLLVDAPRPDSVAMRLDDTVDG
jgi:hypothetical protein